MVNPQIHLKVETLELLFPIFKKISFKKGRSGYVPKSIVLVLFQKESYLLCFKKHCSCFVPKLNVRSWCFCGLFSIGFDDLFTYNILHSD